MAKTRVYELARALNLQNKDLMEKVEELGISVASHMSSLDDDAVEKVKASLRGKPAADVVEETRVKPTVIRRRRKAVSAEEETGEMDAEAAEDAPVSEAPAEAAPPRDPAAEAVEVPPPAAPETESPAPPVRKALKKKVDEPARIITKPEPVEEVKPEAESVVSEPIETAPEPQDKVSSPPATEAPAPAETAETPTAEAVETTPAEASTEAAGPAPEAPKEEAPEEKTEPRPSGKKRRGKKPEKVISLRDRLPKDEPAKIIRRAEMVPAAPIPDPTVAEPESAKPAGDGEVDAGGDRKRKGKRKKVVEEVRPEKGDKKFVKKKISFRRKEVVEGADLYTRTGRGRKGKKGQKGKAAPAAQKPQITTAKAIKRRIKMDETIVLSELAKRMGIKAGEMIKNLMGMGVMATVNQTIDFDTAVLVAAEFGYEIEKASFEEETFLKTTEDAPETMLPRPPVVTIMGHVDHGKTSLLDVIRHSRITDVEAGGITQHIGAYYVETEKGQIVFLDTPGHEAFTAMRSRGAQVTDIVVLVVAADDGVMPQTVEAINHSKAAGVPIIVAINKIDKADANPDRILRQLSELGLNPEDWGGDTIVVRVSAKQEMGIGDLLDMILLQAELLELKANPNKLAVGHVVEAKLESGRGPVATVLVQEGTLHAGDAVVCGVQYGKIRALMNDRGKQVKSVGPAMPAEILGLSGVPNAGDELISLKDEKDAKQVSEYRTQKQRSMELAKTSRLSLENLFEKMKQGEVRDLNLILKADVHGSIEALAESLNKLSNDEVKINIVHSAAGTITETDVSLAAVSNAIIIGFNVRPNPKVQAMANEEHVDMRFYNIIYNVIKDVEDAIVGMMSSTFEEHILGRAEVRQVFHIPKIGNIAGCYVVDGKIQRGFQMRLLRDGVVIYEGKNSSLRRFKDDVKEVQTGYECGIGIENYNDLKIGDSVECFYMEEIKPQLR